MSLGLVSKLVSWAFTSGIGANCWVKPVLYFSFMGFFYGIHNRTLDGDGGGDGVVERERESVTTENAQKGNIDIIKSCRLSMFLEFLINIYRNVQKS